MMFRIIILLLVTHGVLGQDANKTVNSVISQMNRIKSYTVDARIKSDIPLIKILPVKAKIEFKQPDEIKMKTQGIAILPKKGFTDLAMMLKNKSSYTAIFTGYEVIQKSKTESITLLPSNDAGEIVLAKIWVDTDETLILKSQITTRTNGTVVADYQYGKQKEFGLPDELTFSVDVKKFKIPKGVVVDINRSKTAEEPKNSGKTGKINIQFSNYSIKTL
jgi:hypothetical protein